MRLFKILITLSLHQCAAKLSSYLSCSMDGCNTGRSGEVSFLGIPLAEDGIQLKWAVDAKSIAGNHMDINASTSFLGCSSNGRLTACALPLPRGLVVLAADGSLAWASSAVDGSLPTFSGSAPVISDQGDIAVMDGQNITFLDRIGRTYWSKFAQSDGVASRFGPAATDNDYYPVATGAGHLAVWEAGSGLCWADVRLGLDGDSFFAPSSTAAVLGNFMYVATTLTQSPSPSSTSSTSSPLSSSSASVAAPAAARLYRADATKDAVHRIQTRWSYDYAGVIDGVAPSVFQQSSDAFPIVAFFGLASVTTSVSPAGPSSSPSLPSASLAAKIATTATTASSSASSSVLFALQDTGSAGLLLWKRVLEPSPFGLLGDPHGGVWVYDANSSSLLRLNLAKGTPLQVLGLAAVGVPCSRGLLAPLLQTTSSSSLGATSSNALIACFSDARTGGTRVTALRLDAKGRAESEAEVVWSYSLPAGESCTGQLTLMDPNGRYEGGLVVMATDQLRVLALG